MDTDSLLEMLKGIAIFFIHPLLYIGLLAMFLMGISRVKRERKDFHVRVYDFVDDLVRPILPSLIAGFILSVLGIAIGFVFTVQDFIVIGLAYLIVLATLQIRWLSAAYVFPVAALLLFFLSGNSFALPSFGEVSFLFAPESLVKMVFLLAMLLIAEGYLIQKNGTKKTSPRLFKSSRGKFIGGHEGKRIWILPLLCLVPNGSIPSFEFWPLLPVPMSDGSYSIMLIPFFIGFQQLVKSTIPVKPILQMGKQVVGIGLVVLLFAVAGYFLSFFLFITLLLALAAREGLWYFTKRKDEGKVSYFTPREKGVVILGILPSSPAEKMGLKIGEIIIRVNKQDVFDAQSFYSALQRNSAFCKLEVVDESGEIRFTQTALYDGEHHQIGVLLVKEEYELQDSVV